MKKLFGLFIFVLALSVCADVNAKSARAVVKVVKSEIQPEVTAIARGDVFAQFASFDLKLTRGKGAMDLVNIRVEIYSDGKFGAENVPTIGQIFKKICLIANTSPGNSETVERTIISSLAISEDAGISVNLQMNHSFGDGARFTIVAIPKDDVFYNHNGKIVGLALTSVEVSQKGKPVKVIVRKIIMGTEQRVDQNAYAGNVYMGTTTLYSEGSIYQCLYVYATHDIVIKKILFKDYLSKDTAVSAMYYRGSKDYPCLADKDNKISACNFYKRKIELSVEDDGLLLLPSGYWLYLYSKNDSLLLNHFVDPNDLVVVGASMNYRYAPTMVDGGKACFLAGTLVKMSDGSQKPIENMKIGDSVWTGNGKSDKVKGIIKKNDPEWLSIVIGDKFVRTVPDQKFFVMAVVAQEQGVVLSLKDEILYTALMLKVGDIVRDDTGKPVEVRAKSKIYKEKVPTWDLVLRSGVFYYADGCKVHSVVE